MKYLKNINEALKNRKDMSNEEIVEMYFEEAYKTGRSHPNLDAFGTEWEKISPKYHLYDNYYLYKDVILLYSERPDGNWYSQYLDKVNKLPHVFKQEIFDRIEKLEVAFNKI